MRRVVDVHDVALEPELRIGIDLQAALRKPGLIVVGPPHIDLLGHVALRPHAAMPDDQRHNRLAGGVQHAQQV